MQVVNIKKVNRQVEVDFDNLPEQSRAFVVAYGLRQILNDCHSQYRWKERDGTLCYVDAVDESGELLYPSEDAAVEAWQNDVNRAVNEKMAELTSGAITIRAGGGKSADPITARMRSLVIQAIRAHLKSKGLSWNKTPKETREAWIAERMRDETGQLRKIAKAQLKREAEQVGELSIDLSTITAQGVNEN